MKGGGSVLAPVSFLSEGKKSESWRAQVAVIRAAAFSSIDSLVAIIRLEGFVPFHCCYPQEVITHTHACTHAHAHTYTFMLEAF